jgi:hypothetical protein
MNKNLMRGLGVAAALGVAGMGLAACNEVIVEGIHGVGTCNGHAVTIATTQDGPGENFTIEYTGPSTTDVSLFLAQGFYLDAANGVDNYALGAGRHDNVDAIKLDVRGTGWTQGGSGNSTTYSFSGTWADLIARVPTSVDMHGTQGALVLNDVVPLFVGVDCDTTDATGEYIGISSDPVADLTLAAAQPLYPNAMKIDAFDVLANTPTANGADVTLAYSAGALADFGSFSPDAPYYISMYVDDPELSNTDISALWLEAFTASSWTLTPTNNYDGTATVSITGSGGSPLADGDYNAIMLVPDTSFVYPDGPGALKIVFVSMHYSSVTGLTLVSPFVPPSDAALPDTGASAGQLWATGGVAAGLLVIGAASVLVTRRARTRRDAR